MVPFDAADDLRPVRLPPDRNRWLLAVARASFDVGVTLPALAAARDERDVAALLEAPAARAAVLRTLARACAQVNQELFRFELTSLGEPDEPTFAPLGDLAGEPLPVGLADETHLDRKLTVLLPVGDTAGARLVVDRPAKATELDHGVALVIPSFVLARIEAPTPPGGVLMWAHALGPSFR